MTEKECEILATEVGLINFDVTTTQGETGCFRHHEAGMEYGIFDAEEPCPANTCFCYIEPSSGRI